MTLNKTKLKPCPFCGSSAKLHATTSAESIWAYFKIECVKCRAQLMTDLVWRNANSPNLQDVIRAMIKNLVISWNTRTDALLNKQKERIDELEKAGAYAAMHWSDAQHGFECDKLHEFRRVIGQDV